MWRWQKLASVLFIGPKAGDIPSNACDHSTVISCLVLKSVYTIS
jgi:hypothetical protein